MANAKWHGNRFKQTYRANAVARLWQYCAFVEARAKELVPVRTGNLRSKIHSVVNKAQLYGLVGTAVYYAVYVEFGTYKMRARPYLRPALDELRAKLR